jgi:hypothetical protein
VAEGDTVEDGDTLVILESMKMEIPIVAGVLGTVALRVAEGDVVQEGRRDRRHRLSRSAQDGLAPRRSRL